MARPISWLPRLSDIRRSVSNSVRTHYDRPALELLFQMQPRAAGKLMAILPQVEALGRSRLVEKDALLRFLEKVGGADNASTAYTRQRAEKGNVSRKKPRLLVRRELVDGGSLAALPKTVELSRGHLLVTFENRLEMLESLAMVLGAVENNFEEFEERYVRSAPSSVEDRKRLVAEAGEIRELFEDLRQMEANRDKKAN